MQHYVYTHQLRYADFDAAKDSFDYTVPVPQIMETVFVKSCQSIRQHFP